MKSGIPITTIDKIPKTLVFRYSTPIDLKRAALVSKSFRDAANSAFVWQEMIRRYFPYLYNENPNVLTEPKTVFIDKFLSVIGDDIHSYASACSSFLPFTSPSKALVLSSLRGEERHVETPNFHEQKILTILALANGHALQKLTYKYNLFDLQRALQIAASNGCSQGVQLILAYNVPLAREVIINSVRDSSRKKDTSACEMLICALSNGEKGEILLQAAKDNPALVLLLLNNTQFAESVMLKALSNSILASPLAAKHLLSRLNHISKKVFIKSTRYIVDTSQDQQNALRTLQSFSREHLLDLVSTAVSCRDGDAQLEMLRPLLLACPSGCFGEYDNEIESLAEKALLAAAVEDYDDIVMTLLTKHRMSISPKMLGKALVVAAFNRSQRVTECIINEDRNEITGDDLKVALDHATRNRDPDMTKCLLAKREAMSAVLFIGETSPKRRRMN